MCKLCKSPRNDGKGLCFICLMRCASKQRYSVHYGLDLEIAPCAVDGPGKSFAKFRHSIRYRDQPDDDDLIWIYIVDAIRTTTESEDPIDHGFVFPQDMSTCLDVSVVMDGSLLQRHFWCKYNQSTGEHVVSTYMEPAPDREILEIIHY